MKVRKTLVLILTFLFSFFLFLYLTFPFDRIAKRVLYDKGFQPEKVSFRRFPPELFIGELPVGSITLKNVVLFPLSFSRFRLNSELCGGRLSAVFSYPVKELTFNLEGIKLSDCPFNFSQAELAGVLGGEGNLTFKKRHLTAGKGRFRLSDLDLKNVNLGLFSLNALNLGNGSVEYTVSAKDYVRLNGSFSGRDAEVTVSGSVSYNPQNYLNSYVNLLFSVKMKGGKFAGKRFSFTVRGNVNSLRFY